MSTTLNLTGTGLGMTANEMENMVRNEMPDPNIGSKEIFELFNEGQNQISSRYGIPKKWMPAVIPAGKRIGLGVQVASHKNMVIADSKGRQYRVYSTAEAATTKPNWVTDELGGYCVLDLATPSAQVGGELFVRPYDDDATLSLQISLAVKPLPIVNTDDQPFAVDLNGVRSDGAMPELHVCLVHFALFKLFNRLAVRSAGSEAAKVYLSQGQMYYSIFSSAMGNAFEYSDQPFIYPKKVRI